jgi:DNA helicase HerA-like ATPase
MTEGIFAGGGGVDYTEPQYLLLRQGNRHGLIAGATGTGKTVTLQILAEGFSAAGVPVFLSDVKGDVAGLALPGSAEARPHAAFQARAGQIGYDDYAYRAPPVLFWDLFGQSGHPIRTTVAEMGPVLLSRMLELTEAQEGVINIAFRLADDQALPLLDLADLQAMLAWIAENARDLSARYGTVATNSVGAIQRRLLVLENQGGTQLFGEPALDLADLMTVDAAGQGRVSILAADRLMATPRLYATFLLWLLSELFEELPEVGNPDKPRLVFFFDEAHLLFNDAPRALVAKVEQVARLIRSKGVGVYFVTQNPDDIPENVLGQLGNRVQHALRAFTARDRRALKLAAETYRDNPRFSTEDAIRDVGTGEAVTSFLDAKGVPGVVERTLIRPPATHMGPIPEDARARLIAASPLAGKYDTPIDRDSARERLARRAEQAAKEAAQTDETADQSPEVREYQNARRYGGSVGHATAKATRPARASRGDSVAEAFAKSFARQIGTRSGRALVRGILGGLFRGR